MAADVYILVADPARRAVLAQHWVGGNGTRDRVHQVLGRPPDHQAKGFASWGRLTRTEARLIAEAHYANGIDPAGVDQLAIDLPDDQHWWSVWIDW